MGEKNRLRSSIADVERELANKDREFGDRLRRSAGEIDDLRRTNEQLSRETDKLKQEIIVSNEKMLIIRREVEQKTVQVYTAQIQDRDKIISSLERQLKTVREEFNLLEDSVHSSENTVGSYKERLLMVSSELERLNSILTKRNAEIEQIRQ